MESIQEPNSKFEFDRLILTPPSNSSNGNHFIKFVFNDIPLYIQTPKCSIKQGIIKSGKRMYFDIVFTNEHEDFITWIENLENHCQKFIYAKREKWFDSTLEEHDIENLFTNLLKPFKMGKFYSLRVNVPLVTNNFKIYDENETILQLDDIKDNTNVICILEFQGIKCSARGFQIEVETKQILVLKPTNIFDKCILSDKYGKRTKEVDSIKNNDVNILTGRVSGVNLFVDANEILETTHPSSQEENNIKTQDPLQDNLKINIFNNDDTTDVSERFSGINEATGCKIFDEEFAQTISSIDDEKELDFLQIKEQNSTTGVSGIFSESKEPTGRETLDNICESDQIVEKSKDNYNNESMNSPPGDLLEIDLNLEEVPKEDSVVLKERNDVYYEMYKEALRKAKLAKQMALTSYLEAKRIKNLYMLDDLSDESDFEIDEDDLDDNQT